MGKILVCLKLSEYIGLKSFKKVYFNSWKLRKIFICRLFQMYSYCTKNVLVRKAYSQMLLSTSTFTKEYVEKCRVHKYNVLGPQPCHWPILECVYGNTCTYISMSIPASDFRTRYFKLHLTAFLYHIFDGFDRI